MHENGCNEEFLEKVFEWIDGQMSDYFFICDEQLIIQYVSYSIEKVGFSREKVLANLPLHSLIQLILKIPTRGQSTES